MPPSYYDSAYAYVSNTNGLPVNLTNGIVVTESRGIFIGNLSYNVKWQDLRKFLQQAGHVVKCEVPQMANGKGRGHATALFMYATEAQRACDLFDGVTFLGRPMRVRIDKIATKRDEPRGYVTGEV